MNIINTAEIYEFCKKNASARNRIGKWLERIQEMKYSSWHELKEDFGAVDNVGNDHYVFNIGGNRYRLIAKILFPLQEVNIRLVCTHADYDNIKPKPNAISEL